MTALRCVADDCGNEIRPGNRSGLCRSCSARRALSETMKRLHENPVFAYKVSQRMHALNNDPVIAASRSERGAIRKSHARNPEAQRRAAEAKRDKRFRAAVAALDANGRACLDRCIAGGLDRKLAIQLARDEMRIYARAAARMGEAA